MGGKFIRRHSNLPEEHGMGFAALPIPFSFEDLNGFFQFTWDYVEKQTLLHDWPADFASAYRQLKANSALVALWQVWR